MSWQLLIVLVIASIALLLVAVLVISLGSLLGLIVGGVSGGLGLAAVWELSARYENDHLERRRE